MESIAEQLFLIVLNMMGIEHDVSYPKIEIVEQTVIFEKVCQGKKCSAVAYYNDTTETVFISKGMDLNNSVSDQAYYIHEAVHHIQNIVFNKKAIEISCDERLKLEREAYEIQRDYLIANNDDATMIRYILSRFPRKC